MLKIKMWSEPGKGRDVARDVLDVVKGHIDYLPLVATLLVMLDRMHENLALERDVVGVK